MNVVKSAYDTVAPETRTIIGKWNAGKWPVTIYRLAGKTFIQHRGAEGKKVTKPLTPFNHKLRPAFQHQHEF